MIIMIIKKIIEDFTIRNFVNKELNRAGISKIKIHRKSDKLEVIAVVSRPGVFMVKHQLI